MKQFYFISGLPRSGTTLLSAIFVVLDKVNAALSIVKEAASLLATTLIGRDVQYLPSFLIIRP